MSAPFVHDLGADRRMALADGRTMAWCEFGDPAGTPVVSCHGGLMCRFDVEPVAAAARRLGARVISPDRPGVGRSDRAPGRMTGDWVADVAELTEHLGVASFACMGWSLGGQYALALGAGMPRRVTGVAVLAGCVPLDDPPRRAEINRLDKLLMGLALRSPPLARSALAAVRAAAVRSPALAGRAGARFSPPADAVVIRENAGWLAANQAEGLRDLDGVIDEYRAMGGPWGFRPEDVAVPVRLWQGSEDELVPPAWASMLEERLPRAALTVLPGEGHMIGLTRQEDALRALVAEG